MTNTIYHSLLDTKEPILWNINKLQDKLKDTGQNIDTAVGLFPSGNGGINVRLYSNLSNGSFYDRLLMDYEVTDKQIRHNPHNPLTGDSITEIFKSVIGETNGGTNVVLYNDRSVFQEIEKRLIDKGYDFKEI